MPLVASVVRRENWNLRQGGTTVDGCVAGLRIVVLSLKSIIEVGGFFGPKNFKDFLWRSRGQ